MTRIAEVAGYSIGTLYQYFPERRSLLCELMHEVCEDEFEAVMRLLPELQGLDMGARIDRVLEVLVRSAAKNRALLRTVVSDVLPTLDADAVEDLLPAMAALLAADLEANADQVEVRDTEIAARFILVGVEAIVHDAAVDHPEWFDDDTLLDEAKTLVRRYLRVRPPQTP